MASRRRLVKTGEIGEQPGSRPLRARPSKFKGDPVPAAISPEQARERRLLMMGAINSSMLRDEIEEMFFKRYELNPRSVAELKREVEVLLEEESSTDVPSLRRKQVRRLMGLRNQAAGDKKFSAAVQAERLLAEVQGTMAPQRVRHEHEGNVAVRHVVEARHHLVAGMTPEQVNALARGQTEIVVPGETTEEAARAR